MSDRTVGFPPGVAGGVAAYVREVRAELADLPTEEIDDLTGGMEADLSELAAESGGDLVGRLGSPSLYAAELRSAAGLPEQAAGPGRWARSLKEQAAHDRAWFRMLTEQRPWLRSVTVFLVTLRPAWWVLRGYLAAWAAWAVVANPGINHVIRPQGLMEYALAITAIVVSVRLGLGCLRQWGLFRPLIAVGNAAAIIVAVIAFSSGAPRGEDNGFSAATAQPSGVSLDGAQVTNIYAYDSEGRRLTGVRLFAQDGRPLNGAQSSVDANGSPVSLDLNGNPMAVVRDSSGAPLLNVYPQMMFGPDPWLVADPANPVDPGANPPLWTPPLSIVPLAPSAFATSTPTPTPTAAPTASPTAKPATQATPKPTTQATVSTAKPVPEPALPTPSSVPTRR
jgi:hypothetical protein